jgi:hypothetical protein
MRTLVITLENPEETARWVNGDRLDRAAIAGTLVAEARAFGCEALELRSHSGLYLYRWEHGQAVEESIDALAAMLVPLAKPEPTEPR